MKIHIYISSTLLVLFIMFMIFVNVEITSQENKLKQYNKIVKYQQQQIDSLSMKVKKLEDVNVATKNKLIKERLLPLLQSHNVNLTYDELTVMEFQTTTLLTLTDLVNALKKQLPKNLISMKIT